MEIDQLAISPLGCPTVPNIDIFSLQGAFSTNSNNNKKAATGATAAAMQYTEKTSLDIELDEITEYLEKDAAKTLARKSAQVSEPEKD